MTLKATIIIPTYNQPDLIIPCLNSFKNQTSGDFEIIVVDDGSSKPIYTIVNTDDYLFPLVTIRHDPNKGRAAARNSGINNAQHELIIFLDGDMTVNDGFVAAHLAAHRNTSNTQVIIGDILTAPEFRNDPLAQYIDTRGVHKLSADTSVPYRYFVTGNSSAKKSFLQQVGLFDETFPVYGGEDLELACRLAKAGGQFGYCSQAQTLHYDLKFLPEYCQRLEEYGERSIPIIIKKHPQAAEFLKLNWVDQQFSRSKFDVWKRWLSIILFSRPIVFVLSRMIGLVPVKRARFFLLDIVTGGSYLRGYRRQIKKPELS